MPQQQNRSSLKHQKAKNFVTSLLQQTGVMPHKEEQPSDISPSVIPRPRGNRARHVSYLFLALCVCYLCLAEQSLDLVFHCIVIHFTALQVGALCKGVCHFAEELRHVTSRYNGSYFRALNACLELRKRSFLFLLLCGVAYLHRLKETGLPVCWNLTIVCFCQLLNIVFDLQHPSAAEISEMYERNNCNVAQGLAWSYYVGYLKLVLPRLKDLIREFNQSNTHLRNCEKTWKLHILIPLSCDVCDDLQKVDSRIHFIKNLPELNMDIAGIKRRSYKNSVYGISEENKKEHFCVVEYATPLRSLFAMSQDESAAFSRQDRLEQAKLFCRALEDILQRSKDCSGCYRLIVYDDPEENDKHFLSKTILRHIEQELQEEYTMDERQEDSTDNVESKGTQLLISGSDLPMSLHSYGY